MSPKLLYSQSMSGRIRARQTQSNCNCRWIYLLSLLFVLISSCHLINAQDDEQYSYASDSPNVKQYLNQFAIEIDHGPNADTDAKKIAHDMGYIYKGKVCILFVTSFVMRNIFYVNPCVQVCSP